MKMFLKNDISQSVLGSVGQCVGELTLNQNAQNVQFHMLYKLTIQQCDSSSQTVQRNVDILRQAAFQSTKTLVNHCLSNVFKNALEMGLYDLTIYSDYIFLY